MIYFLLLSILGASFYFLIFSPTRLKPPAKQISSVPYQRKVTIVMNTFERHLEMEEAVDYYSTCDLVAYIYIVWSEKTAPSDYYHKKYTAQKQPKVRLSYACCFLVYVSDTWLCP
jgi:hypothetical protein